jgi:hypothetical protein
MDKLTKKDILLEYAKCSKSPSYTIESYFETFDKTQEGFVPFKLFDEQKRLIYNYENNRFNLVKKYRQAGISTVTAAYSSVKISFAPSDNPERILILANKQETAIEFLTKITGFIKQLPKWVGVTFVKSSQKHVKFSNGSEIKAVATSPDALRGYTPTLLIMDEAAFIEGGQALWSACLAAIGTGGAAILISTPNGLDEIYYEVYEGAINGTNKFKITHLKWWRDPRFAKDLRLIKTSDIISWIQKKPEDKDEEIIENARNFTFDEIEDYISKGYSPHSTWYENMCRDMNLNRRMINQELESAFIGSGDNVVDANTIRLQETVNVKDPIFKDKDWDNNLWIWELPKRGHRYILGCLPYGELVKTRQGLKKVQDVSLHDELVNIDGEFVKILNKQIYNVEQEPTYELKISNTAKVTKFTREHPIFVAKFEKGENIKSNIYHKNFDFVKSEKLNKNYWLKIPNQYKKIKLDYKIQLNKYNQLINNEIGVNNLLNNDYFWLIAGFWLGNYTSSKKIGYKNEFILKFRKENLAYLEKIDKILDDTKIKKSKKKLGILLESKIILLFLLKEFTNDNMVPEIREWIKYAPENIKNNFILGILNSLGSFKEKNGNLLFKLRFNIDNITLVDDIQDILMSLGLLSDVSVGKKYIDINFSGEHAKKLFEYFGYDNFTKSESELKYRSLGSFKNTAFISDYDYSIYLKILGVKKTKFSGVVYNFECDTHTFMARNIVTHNCDVSRGDSEDGTGISIIDYDTYEQVLEYHGKIPPDISAQLVYHYGKMYSALSTFDITGGMGIATTNKLKELNYPKNLFHYDNTSETPFYIPPPDAIPGINFASKNRRSQIIAALEEAISRGEFKIRSERLISELKKFVYRNGKPDHLKGSHDDLIMALGMCLFVANTSFKKLHQSDSQVKAMLDSWKVVNNTNNNSDKNYLLKETINTKPEDGKVYDNSQLTNNNMYNTVKFGWLFGKKK